MVILTDQKLKVCPTCLRPNNTEYNLTLTEQKLLTYINEYKTKNQKSPTWMEIRDHLNQRSTSNIHRVINKLKDHGFLDYIIGKKRSLTVLRFK